MTVIQMRIISALLKESGEILARPLVSAILVYSIFTWILVDKPSIGLLLESPNLDCWNLRTNNGSMDYLERLSNLDHFYLPFQAHC